MGQQAAKQAKSKKEEVKDQMDSVMIVLKNKLKVFKAQVALARGKDNVKNRTEVAGGRTVMMVSEIRVATSEGIDQQIMNGLNDFFLAAQGGAVGDDAGAKHAAINGAKNVLSAGINAILGVSEGQSAEKKSFVVLFLNNAFVRVDYYLYSFMAVGKKWGSANCQAGMCYLTDMSVLRPEDLQPSEITFLLSQAFSAQTERDLVAIAKLKLLLVEQNLLSKYMKEATAISDFESIKKISVEYDKTTQGIEEAFYKLEHYEPENEK